MRIRLVVALATMLVLSGCASNPTTLIAGDDGSGDVQAADAVLDQSGAVANDSAPIETQTTLPPQTTVPWEVTLEEYPLLKQLHETQGASIGRATFVLVEMDGEPVFSGAVDYPQFAVTIDGWYAASNFNDIEFTMSHANVSLVDGQVDSEQCANNWAWLAQPDPGVFARLENQLPDVAGTELEWASYGCAEDLTIDFEYLFEDTVMIDVTDAGFNLADATGETHSFTVLAAPPNSTGPDVATTEPTATTEPPQTTTTELDNS